MSEEDNPSTQDEQVPATEEPANPYSPPNSNPVDPPAGSSIHGSQNPEERNWAMFSHLAGLLGWVLWPANIIAPIIIWQMKKDTMPFAASEAKESLNFQITMLIYAAISFVLCFVIIGFFLLIALMIFDVVCTIIGGMKANDGKPYRYPMTIRFIR